MKPRQAGVLSDFARARWRRITIFAAALLLFPLPAVPATITVDEPTDVVATDGKCSLPEAIDNANMDTDTTGSDCASGEAGLDTIQLTTSVTLSTDLPDVFTEVTVEGNGFTVDANGIAGSVFVVNTTGTLIVNRVTVTGAIDGGITNEGTAELIDSLVVLNEESGIQNDANARLTLTNTIVAFNLNDGDGGGIDNVAELTLINSTVSDNEAEWGGGIFNDRNATLILNNSTVSNNTANEQGGGIYNNDDSVVTVISSTISGNSAMEYGGGIYNDANGSVILRNSTLSGNIAGQLGGGIYNVDGGAATLSNSTLSGNSGGGIYVEDGGVTLINTIVANSIGDPNCFGSALVTDGGNNFDDDGSCGVGFGTITNLDPVLADNGGPTLTHALLPGSSAVDAIPDGECVDDEAAPLTVDQRGLPRPVDGDTLPGALCDSGSYELTLVGGCCTDGPGTESPCVVTDQVECESGGGLFLGPGSDCLSNEECTALLVTMDAMSAVATGDGVLVRWTTALEFDTAGFQVLRESAQTREKAAPVLIPVGPRILAMGDSFHGAEYELLDDSRGARRAQRYYIEDIDLYGRVTRHGPIEVTRDGRELPAGRQSVEARR